MGLCRPHHGPGVSAGRHRTDRPDAVPGALLLTPGCLAVQPCHQQHRFWGTGHCRHLTHWYFRASSENRVRKVYVEVGNAGQGDSR